MQCRLCKKKRMVGHKISHSNHKTKKQQHPNVQKQRIHLANGTIMRIGVCTRCLRSDELRKAG